MELRLQNLRAAGFRPKAAIDIGAYRGEWACAARRCFPGLPVLLIEPQEKYRPDLERFCAANLPCRVETCLVGREPGQTWFTDEESNSRVVDREYPGAREIPIRDLTSVVTGNRFDGADFLKVDAQGYELPILDGMGDRLRKCEIVILEVSVIRIGPVPTMHEVMDYMRGRGFRLYDVAEPRYRPRDSALWQLDAFFANDTSGLVSSLNWD